VPLFMMLTSLKNMSDGRTKNRHHGIKAIVTFKRDGYSNRKTADLLHVIRNTVNEYVRIFKAHGLTDEELMDLEDQSLHDLFPCITEVESHRFVTLSDQLTYFQRELKKPGCTIHTFWREYSNGV
jgi:hypothetical protein